MKHILVGKFIFEFNNWDTRTASLVIAHDFIFGSEQVSAHLIFDRG